MVVAGSAPGCGRFRIMKGASGAIGARQRARSYSICICFGSIEKSRRKYGRIWAKTYLKPIQSTAPAESTRICITLFSSRSEAIWMYATSSVTSGRYSGYCTYIGRAATRVREHRETTEGVSKRVRGLRAAAAASPASEKQHPAKDLAASGVKIW